MAEVLSHGGDLAVTPGVQDGVYRLSGRPKWGPASGLDGFLRVLDFDESSRRTSWDVQLRECSGTGRVDGILHVAVGGETEGQGRLTGSPRLRVTSRMSDDAIVDLDAAVAAIIAGMYTAFWSAPPGKPLAVVNLKKIGFVMIGGLAVTSVLAVWVQRRVVRRDR